MRIFFSPTSRLRVSRPLAFFMNTLNMLGPALLLCAVLLLLYAQFGTPPTDVRQVVVITAALLIVSALCIRILWGIAIRILSTRQAARSGAETHTS